MTHHACKVKDVTTLNHCAIQAGLCFASERKESRQIPPPEVNRHYARLDEPILLQDGPVYAIDITGKYA